MATNRNAIKNVSWYLHWPC